MGVDYFIPKPDFHLDEEIHSEFRVALSKTGWTPALQHAAKVLPILFSMKPETVEAYMATRLDETL